MGKVVNRVCQAVGKSRSDPVGAALAACPSGCPHARRAAKRVIPCSAQPMSIPERSEPPFSARARSAHNMQAEGAQRVKRTKERGSGKTPSSLSVRFFPFREWDASENGI